MGELKAITGHTRARRLQAYLERGGRALARDFINLAPPLAGEDASGMPAYGEYRWAAAMDATREAAGNDLPWRGRAARTWKHYVISPDPRNAIALPELRKLACSWAERWFPDNEVAIVYHDDNPGRIPHAHVVVNNTCLSTGRRMQVPDPLALNRSLQEMEAERGLEHHHPTTGGKEARPRPRTRQRVHVRRAERELAGRGRASWVADIRSRVELARAAAGGEAEFRSLLAAMGVEVSDASTAGGRPRDWIYALEGSASRRVRGESLGLDYGRGALRARWAASRAPSIPAREVARIAARAVGIEGERELRELAEAVSALERHGVRGTAALDRAISSALSRGDLAAAGELEAARALLSAKGIELAAPRPRSARGREDAPRRREEAGPVPRAEPGRRPARGREDRGRPR